MVSAHNASKKECYRCGVRFLNKAARAGHLAGKKHKEKMASFRNGEKSKKSMKFNSNIHQNTRMSAIRYKSSQNLRQIRKSYSAYYEKESNTCASLSVDSKSLGQLNKTAPHSFDFDNMKNLHEKSSPISKKALPKSQKITRTDLTYSKKNEILNKSIQSECPPDRIENKKSFLPPRKKSKGSSFPRHLSASSKPSASNNESISSTGISSEPESDFTNSATFYRMKEVWSISELLEKLRHQQTSLKEYILKLTAAFEQNQKDRVLLKERRSALLKEIEQLDSPFESDSEFIEKSVAVFGKDGYSTHDSNSLNSRIVIESTRIDNPCNPLVTSTVSIPASEVQIFNGTDASGTPLLQVPVVARTASVFSRNRINRSRKNYLLPTPYPSSSSADNVFSESSFMERSIPPILSSEKYSHISSKSKSSDSNPPSSPESTTSKSMFSSVLRDTSSTCTEKNVSTKQEPVVDMRRLQSIREMLQCPNSLQYTFKDLDELLHDIAS